jgi:predicted nucleotidyltransferase
MVTKPSTRLTGTPSSVSLSDALFSGTQQRVLGLLFGQPLRSFYLSEIIALSAGGSGAVQRELARLSHAGLITPSTQGNQKHFQANPASPIYSELCAISQKTFGLADPLRKALAPLARQINAAFVYGSVARREDTASSDIDLMLVSDQLEYGELFITLEELGQQLGRAVNPTIYSRAELAQRIGRKDTFITRVLAQPRIWLVGGEDVFSV